MSQSEQLTAELQGLLATRAKADAARRVALNDADLRERQGIANALDAHAQAIADAQDAAALAISAAETDYAAQVENLTTQINAVVAKLAALPDPPPPPGPVFPVQQFGVVLSEPQIRGMNVAELDRIIAASGSSTQKTTVRASQKFASKTYTPYQPGSTMPSDTTPNGPLATWRDDSVAAKIQALLWHRTGDPVYLDNVAKICAASAGLKAFAPDSIESRRLNCGWYADNITQTLAILPDFPGRQAFVDMLVTVVRPLLDWWGGTNWLASFSAARLGIDVLSGNKMHWAEDLAYFRARIRECIYISSDGPSVNKLEVRPGVGNGPIYLHWDETGSKFTGALSTSAVPILRGMSAEFYRDLSHAQMGMDGWAHAISTIYLQGADPGADAVQRFSAFVEFQAGVVDRHLAGNDMQPFPKGGEAGTGWLFGWYPVLQLFAPSRVPTVTKVGSSPRVQAVGVGGCHQIAETVTYVPGLIL